MADTRGTNRDYDESETSKNQGHGHPREERERSDEAGASGQPRPDVTPDAVRGDDKPGGEVRRKAGDQADGYVRDYPHGKSPRGSERDQADGADGGDGGD